MNGDELVTMNELLHRWLHTSDENIMKEIRMREAKWFWDFLIACQKKIDDKTTNEKIEILKTKFPFGFSKGKEKHDSEKHNWKKHDWKREGYPLFIGKCWEKQWSLRDRVVKWAVDKATSSGLKTGKQARFYAKQVNFIVCVLQAQKADGKAIWGEQEVKAGLVGIAREKEREKKEKENVCGDVTLFKTLVSNIANPPQNPENENAVGSEPPEQKIKSQATELWQEIFRTHAALVDGYVAPKGLAFPADKKVPVMGTITEKLFNGYNYRQPEEDIEEDEPWDYEGY